MAEGFEASTAELFDVEEDENMVQPVAGKPISQEIPITELVEEEDAEIATSQLLPEETAANEQRNEPVEAAEKQQMEQMRSIFWSLESSLGIVGQTGQL